MDELVYITGKYQTSYQHFNEDDTVTEFMDGYMIDVFIPATRAEDIDRNDDFRREVTSKINAALQALQDGNG
jgi:hypothetical protein